MENRMGEELKLDGFSAKSVQGSISQLDTDHVAVIVVDMVNDFLEPDGVMPVEDPSAVLSAVSRLVSSARASGAPVVWVRPGHTESADGLFRKRTPHAIGNGHGAQVHQSLEVLPGEKHVLKRRYSSFFSTDLDMYLREHEISAVIVCGVALNICVRSTVHDAFFLGYDVYVAEDACKATSQREHDSTVYDINTHFGTVVQVAEIAAGLRR